MDLHEQSTETKTLIDELYFCAAECHACYNACDRETDKESLERCMLLDKDCGEICHLTGEFLERNSELAPSMLKLCLEACEKCAEECEKHAHMDHCKSCAAACRKCAELCRRQMDAYKWRL
jgi:hypothetical protein